MTPTTRRSSRRDSWITSTTEVIDGKWYVLGTDGDRSRSC
jgi:hypothetical protein